MRGLRLGLGLSRKVMGGGAPPPPVPVNTVLPVITAPNPYSGQTISASTGTWTNSPTSYTYQWYLGASPISGETSSTYVIRAADDGDITVGVVASNAGGAGTEAVSAAVTVYSPLSVADLELWVDSYDASTIVQAAGLVSRWDDKSGNGYNAAQGTPANQPETGIRTLNSKNVIDYNADRARTLTLPSGTYPLATGSHTVFIVSGCDASTNDHQFYRARRVSPSTIRNYISGGAAFKSRAGVSASEISVTSDTNPHIFCNNRNGSNLSFYIDGGTAAGSLTGVSDNVIEEYVLGMGLDGFIAEKLVYARTLSTSEMNEIGAYLSAKWGITWTNI